MQTMPNHLCASLCHNLNSQLAAPKTSAVVIPIHFHSQFTMQSARQICPVRRAARRRSDANDANDAATPAQGSFARLFPANSHSAPSDMNERASLSSSSYLSICTVVVVAALQCHLQFVRPSSLVSPSPHAFNFVHCEAQPKSSRKLCERAQVKGERQGRSDSAQVALLCFKYYSI